MDLKAPLRGVDSYQQRHAWLGFPLAVIKKFSDDQGGHLAGLIAYYGFFSLFPLLLVFVSVLGFVLSGHPGAQRSVVDSALKQFPIVGPELRTHGLSGSGIGLAIGIVVALLSGLGVTLAAQSAFNHVYAVPHKERPNFIKARARGLAMLIALGGLQIVSTAASGLVAGGFGGAALKVAGYVISLALNLVLFFAAFRLLTDSSVPTRELVTGVVVSAIGWEILQVVGGAYIGHVVKGASQTYGTFATVIGLLTWIFLGARLVVYAAEVNVVRSRRLWPRALFESPGAADRRALTALAKVEERTDEEQVDVSFSNPDGGDASHTAASRGDETDAD